MRLEFDHVCLGESGCPGNGNISVAGGQWQAKSVMPAGGCVLTAWLPGHHLALGGGGLAHFIIRLFIWHEISRLFRYLWRIPTFGPFIVVALGLVLVGFVVWRMSRGRGQRGRRRGGGSAGRTAGSGTRDW